MSAQCAVCGNVSDQVPTTITDEELDNALLILHTVAPCVMWHHGRGWCPERIWRGEARLVDKGLLVRYEMASGCIGHKPTS